MTSCQPVGSGTESPSALRSLSRHLSAKLTLPSLGVKSSASVTGTQLRNVAWTATSRSLRPLRWAAPVPDFPAAKSPGPCARRVIHGDGRVVGYQASFRRIGAE